MRCKHPQYRLNTATHRKIRPFNRISETGMHLLLILATIH
ncbi:MAG: hypothetical protein ACJAZY_003555 [Spirosomataceae bacterium]|jgi:hypothetical protein